MGNLNFLAFAHILNLCKLASFFFLGVLGIWLPLFADEDSLTKWQGVDQESKNILPKKLPLAETLLYTLTNLDDIKISQLNIVANEGIWQNSAGPFDPTLSCNGNFISTQNTQDQGADRKTDYPSHNSFIQLSANKTARAGTNFSLFAQTSKTHNPLWFPNDRTNNAFISFRINQPLLRGFLFNQNAVNEASNALQIQASRFDTLQTIAQAILNTTNAYWDLVVNQKILAEIKKEEKKLIELTGRIQKLADANIIARGDLEQTKNRLTGRKLQILASEQSLQGSLQQLKFSMGVSVEGFNEDQPDLYELDDFKILELEPLQKRSNGFIMR